jgi:S-methylmethionine-dependent homocysteine/selenocysteine methylase
MTGADRTRPVLLDGGMATELQRHGTPMSPPWLTSEPLRTPAGRALLTRVHADYIRAGAEVVTANTFRTNLRALRRAGLDRHAAGRMVSDAVAAARQARELAGAGSVRVAGSIAPVEDCYQPALVPPVAELRAEHDWLARSLADAGVDLVLIETMNSLAEAEVAVEAVVRIGLPAWVSFVCTDGGRLLSGTDLGVAARRVAAAGAAAVLVNCTAVDRLGECLARLRAVAAGPIGVYPNIEDRSAVPDWTHVEHRLPTGYGSADLARLAEDWLADGVGIIGGCCGSTPAHIAAVRAVLDRGAGAGAVPTAAAAR